MSIIVKDTHVILKVFLEGSISGPDIKLLL